MTITTLDKLKVMQEKVKTFITLKRYLYILLGISIFFLAYLEIKISLIYMLFAFIGLIYHDKLKDEIWIKQK